VTLHLPVPDGFDATREVLPFDAVAFIREHAPAGVAPLVPELKLHLCAEAIPLWEEVERRLGRSNTPPPYWAFAWPGGQAVARWILDNPDSVRGKTVLDFASGGGISALACVKAGAARVVANEIDPLALATIALNGRENGLELELLGRDVLGVDEGWDVVIAGDVCYERLLATRVDQWRRALAARGARVLLGDPGRNYFDGRALRELARYRVPTTRDLEDREWRDTGVYEVVADTRGA